ncbi:hypothetical protein DTO027B5_8964 [Paecilomyces variotii]|nr:hypothetical protein DTO207G8_3465 [Paecilomyces variotii]KAJ9309428.1 hypothetical protein DTO217A2_1046 [Paecilomyces variotii]KAJ9321765.1 hypothetical protein DTO027B3_7155 [Paecilomyces variotii]KAJ9327663.1 hypothetical protein DTO027B5_8964 [Paecilomyces variotii]KAJ9389220.1 hypothetical protein DTO063F5_2380 [Paecilomyces variotii]
MPTKAVVARLVAKDEDAKSQLLGLLRVAADNAFSNEPGLRRYAITEEAPSPLPQPPNERAIWVVEEYTDELAYEKHLQQPPIRDLGAWLAGGLGEEPKIWTLDVQEDSNFTKPEVTKHENPTIVFTELAYKPGTQQSTLPYWKKVADVSKDESGTFIWGVALNREDTDSLAIIHVYESTDYLVRVHATSKEMQETQDFTADLKIRLSPYFLKLVAGYLWK